MGGSAPQVQTPNPMPSMMALQGQQQAISNAEQARAEMLKNAAGITPYTYYPDIWGQAGAYNTSKDTAYLNAVNSQALQQAVDPLGAKIRQNTEQMTANITDPAALQKASQQEFAQRTLPGMYGTGLNPSSTIYGSALFDKNTLAGIQLQQSLAQLGQPYQNLPQTGLNPSMTASAPMQAGAQAAAQGNAFMQGILGQTGQLQQSVEQGANSLYNNMGQDINTIQANQLAAQQANQAAQSQQNAALYQGLGSLGGGLLSAAKLPLGGGFAL
jgi:hypothetical protein